MGKSGKTYRALVHLDIYGYVEEDNEHYHEIYLYAGDTYDVELEADDEDVDIDLYITDSEGTIIYQDEDSESTANAWFKANIDSIFRFYVKAVDGDTSYTLTIRDQEIEE